MLCLLGWIVGCGGTATIDPGTERGRAALEAALSAWQSGETIGQVAGTTPPVHVVDTNWGQGKKLASYEIREAVAGTNPPSWKVSLQFEGQSNPVETTYVLVGEGPIWVYHQEDFLRTMNMDNNPTSRNERRR